MDRIAKLSPKDRQDVFAEAAAQLGIRPAIVEKDFWVCFVLRLLFSNSGFEKSLVFKGGTSLSKVHGIIERFSEDIDLVLDWQLIGFGTGLRDPFQKFESNTKQDRFNIEMNRLAAEFIRGTLAPRLDELAKATDTGLSAAVDSSDPQVVNIHYPAAFPERYLRPEVRLEIGPTASWIPSMTHSIHPYAHEALPKLFANPHCEVRAISAERTFWEKATILHREAYRSGLIPQRYSRHYYDLYKLARSPFRDSSLANIDLLGDVLEFKERFYPSKWARYDLAVPGSFKLLPSEAQFPELERDYQDMQIMLFGDVPEFSSILDELRNLEAQINSRTKQ